MNYKIDWQVFGVLFVTGIITIVVFYTSMAIINIEIPSEMKCQSIYGDGMSEKKYAEKYFCEFNETGWHLNKTKFLEALSRVDGLVT